jgi:hypothetical protein
MPLIVPFVAPVWSCTRAYANRMMNMTAVVRRANATIAAIGCIMNLLIIDIYRAI